MIIHKLLLSDVCALAHMFEKGVKANTHFFVVVKLAEIITCHWFVLCELLENRLEESNSTNVVILGRRGCCLHLLQVCFTRFKLSFFLLELCLLITSHELVFAFELTKVLLPIE